MALDWVSIDRHTTSSTSLSAVVAKNKMVAVFCSADGALDAVGWACDSSIATLEIHWIMRVIIWCIGELIKDL